MAALVSVWMWFEIFALATLCFVVQLALAPLTWPFDRGRRITGRLLRLTGVAATALTPFWRVRVLGPLPAEAPRRTVVVSNHCSNADAFVISHLPWEMKWLAKSTMFRVPIIGWSMGLAGDVAVVRGDRQSADTALDGCAKWLERGVPVMIFPEGTRSLDGRLGAFKDGAFRLAITTGADMLPIAVAGTAQALPKHSWRFGRARALVTVGEPISTRGMTLADMPALKESVREAIEALRARLAQA